MKFNRYKRRITPNRTRGISFFEMPTYAHGYRNRAGRKDDLRAKGRANAMVDVVSWRFDPNIYITSRGRTAVLHIGQESVHLSKLELRRGFFDCVLRPSPAPNREALRAIFREYQTIVDHLDVIVDSAGGVTQSALGIAQALTGWRQSKRLLIDGQCSSAATLILCMPKWDSVAITNRSRITVHSPRVTSYARGKKTGAFRLLGETRGTSGKRFAKLYARRTGRKMDEVRQWIEDGRTFTAAEACMVGFADEMMPRTMWEDMR